jgi:hypothetical protein
VFFVQPADLDALRPKTRIVSKKRVFVGYSENSTTYNIYAPCQRKIEVRRDLTFHEEATFKKSIKLQQESEAVQPTSPSSENEESYD